MILLTWRSFQLGSTAWCNIFMQREHRVFPFLSPAPLQGSCCGDASATSFTLHPKPERWLCFVADGRGSRMERGSSFILSSQNLLQVALVVMMLRVSFPPLSFLTGICTCLHPWCSFVNLCLLSWGSEIRKSLHHCLRGGFTSPVLICNAFFLGFLFW